jgi:aldehyde:ferredoxin oxidoreductase
MCQFVSLGISDNTLAKLLSAAIGHDFSVDDLYIIGERGSNVERCFNVREGLRRNWDTCLIDYLRRTHRLVPLGNRW